MATRITLVASLRRILRDQDVNDYIWTAERLNECVNAAIWRLWPEIYKRKMDSIGTTGLNTYSYPLPVGAERVGRVEVKNADGVYDEVLEWEEQQVDFGESASANAIVFRNPPLTAGNDIRAIYRGKFTTLSVDGTVTDHPDYCDDVVLVEASAEAMEDLLSERSRFMKYAARMDREVVSVDDLVKIINHRHDRFNALLDMFRMPPIESKRQRAYGMTEGVQPAHSGRSRLGAVGPGGND